MNIDRTSIFYGREKIISNCWPNWCCILVWKVSKSIRKWWAQDNISRYIPRGYNLTTFRIKLLFYLFFTVVPSNTCVSLSCRPFIVYTFSTGLLGVEVSSVSCPSQEKEETSKPTRPVENVVFNNEKPTGKKHTNVGWDDGGKIGKIIN